MRRTGKLSTSDFDCAVILPALNFTFKGYSSVVKGGSCTIGVFEVCVYVCMGVCVSALEGGMSYSHVHHFKSLSCENMLCTAEFPERLIKSVVFVLRAKVRMDMCLVVKCTYRAVWENILEPGSTFSTEARFATSRAVVHSQCRELIGNILLQRCGTSEDVKEDPEMQICERDICLFASLA